MGYIKLRIQKKARDFPGGPVVGNLPFNLGSIPGLGRASGGGQLRQ